MKDMMKRKFPDSLFHNHAPDAIRDRLTKRRKNSLIRDFVYGSIDGAVTTFSIVAGVKGAGLSTMTILILGFSNIVSDGFSMAASNYLGTKADRDEKKMIEEFENKQIDVHPQGEIEEVKQIFKLKGFDGELLNQAVDAVVSNRREWVRTMLLEEYGFSMDTTSPILAGAMTFIAFLFFGMIPLVPYILKADNAFTWATVLTGLSFFLLGTLKSRWSMERGWLSGVKTFLIGAIAASLAYGVGILFTY